SPTCTATAPDTAHIVVNILADPAAIEAAQNLIADEDRGQQEAYAHRQPGTESKAEAEAEVETEPEVESEASAEPEAEREAAAEVEAEVEAEAAGEAEPEAEAGAEAEAEAAVESEPEPQAEAEASNPVPCPQDSGTAMMPDGTILPIPALAEALRAGARIKPLWQPGPDPEPHYRPSAKLAAFVRARDLFCRFPGCDVPAARCDVDHVVPWPYGPTHASNLHCKCRTHHLAKTFWDGWSNQQHPDGTVTWTTPAGARYTTTPGSRLFFPHWNTTTAQLPPLAKPPPDPDRTAKMPKRRRTRAAENTARIKAERAHNAAQRRAAAQAVQAARVRAARAQHPPPEPQHLPNYGDDPPPF
ncbi:HNH endonuclease signature motif containing protein, partial [Mycobacterium sp. 852013-51886_SCH5428379]|uniref:HNH endonuclease signature motif containing protein n=1 Tax=Mycobacterium sp. 852013-51886_SCH5428379 TaxID=1834111 RepID=UPI000B0AF62A